MSRTSQGLGHDGVAALLGMGDVLAVVDVCVAIVT